MTREQLASKIKTLIDAIQERPPEDPDSAEAQSLRRAVTHLGDAHAELSRKLPR